MFDCTKHVPFGGADCALPMVEALKHRRAVDTSNGFSIAYPGDARMLDVVGFDSATPQVISDVAA